MRVKYYEYYLASLDPAQATQCQARGLGTSAQSWPLTLSSRHLGQKLI